MVEVRDLSSRRSPALISHRIPVLNAIRYYGQLPLPCPRRLAYFVVKLMTRFLKEFLRFAMREKKWWLIPLLLILVVVGLMLFLSAGSGISWALYPSK